MPIAVLAGGAGHRNRAVGTGDLGREASDPPTPPYVREERMRCIGIRGRPTEADWTPSELDREILSAVRFSRARTSPVGSRHFPRQTVRPHTSDDFPAGRLHGRFEA